MLQESYPLYVANRPERPNLDLAVKDKFSGDVATRVPLAPPEIIETAIGKAAAAARAMRELPAYERQAVLRHCAARFEERAEELAYSLCVEAGKPIRDSRGEVTRLVDTFRIAAEEATRLNGEVLELEVTPRARGYRGQTMRVPIGPCSFISPFNFPLNLAAHKIAPALAVGCPFVLKPASRTPVGALLIGEILAECSLPEGAFSILPVGREGADAFVTDERLKLLSFTGSSSVGWDLKARAGKKRVMLELGGNAACVIDEGTDLEDAVQRLVIGAFYQSGQSCISVQRVLVHETVHEELRERFVEAARSLTMGDPKREETFIGPLISESEAIRLESWISEAVDAGARLLTGGERTGAILAPTLLEDVPEDQRLCAEEAFGPVAVLSRFTNFEDALAQVNRSRYGLQAGVFTRDVYRMERAWRELDVGGVVIGDVPSWRVDHMPYGGVKDSGHGREGLRWSMEEMTEPRLLVLRTPPSA